MSNLTSFDWWLATYLVAAGVGYAFYIGQLIVKLLLIRFASHKRIDDGLWRFSAGDSLRRTEGERNYHYPSEAFYGHHHENAGTEGEFDQKDSN